MRRQSALWGVFVTPDDATGHITSVFLAAEEGTMSSFQGLSETITRYGLFSAFYTDRGSHYFLTPEAGGRMERAFGTLQGRLPQELRLRGLATMAAANTYLHEVFMVDFNARFGVATSEEGSAFIAYAGPALADTLCVQEDRRVGRDNCVSWQGRALQIPQQAHRHHYVRATVSVRHYPDASLAIFDGPRCLGRYDAASQPAAPTTSDPVTQEAA